MPHKIINIIIFMYLCGDRIKKEKQSANICTNE